MREPQEIQDQEHEQAVRRVAAIDVAKASGWSAPGWRPRAVRAGS
jgi:hypothetical protein